MGEHIEVMLDGVRVIDCLEAVNPRPGAFAFALKAWGSTVRFGHVKVWARNVGLSRPVPGVWIPIRSRDQPVVAGLRDHDAGSREQRRVADQ